MDPKQHRKRVKHLDVPGHVHELTFSCYHRLPLLLDRAFPPLLSTAIDRAMQRHRFRLIAFIYMPEHVHLLVLPLHEESKISGLLAGIKRPVSFQVRKHLEATDDPRLQKLTIRERPGTMRFRFWQEGPGYDRNITNPDTLRTAIDYLQANPIRRGLCQMPGEWPWSSWHAHQGDPPSLENLPTVHGWPVGW
jgi:REP-associated tyrosine transposase